MALALPSPNLGSTFGDRQAVLVGENRRQRRGTGRLLPFRLGPYTLLEHIGKGGMADIYRASQQNRLGIERHVVIKEVLPELRERTRFAELLVSEAKLASSLHHPNIVRIEQLGRDLGSLFIAMEYVDGIDLRDLLRRCARSHILLPADFALHVVLEVLEALSHAHRYRWDANEEVKGIVHRDVSPSNVLLGFDGQVKLCDFGIARAHDVDIDGALTSAMIEGKAGYMSPEQASGLPLDARADLFAVGILLFELLTGRKYYRASAGTTLLQLAREAEPRSLDLAHLPASDKIARIVGRALAASREDRYGSAEELTADLSAYVADTTLVSSSMRFGEWLCENFEPSLRRERTARELAGKAIALGPVVELRVLLKPPSKPSAEEDQKPRSMRPTSQPSVLPKSPSTEIWVLGMAVLVLALLIAFMLK